MCVSDTKIITKHIILWTNHSNLFMNYSHKNSYWIFCVTTKKMNKKKIHYFWIDVVISKQKKRRIILLYRFPSMRIVHVVCINLTRHSWNQSRWCRLNQEHCKLCFFFVLKVCTLFWQYTFWWNVYDECRMYFIHDRYIHIFRIVKPNCFSEC